MVAAFHAAGIEVILDVVYNHTAEGGFDGPTLSFRGIDNRAYYRLSHGGTMYDVTGTGNSVDTSHPQVRRLVMDSLRYWVEEMGVDGFRFDLAVTLIRNERHEVDTVEHPFLAEVAADPVLGRVKLIAEPWDVGHFGYQVGNFGTPWSEWNGKFRDSVRDVWRTSRDGVQDLAYRLSGSSDLYGDDGRYPYASINFVTAHDGFTLRDLVSLRPQAQRGQPRGQPGRHRRQPVLELRGRGRDGRPGRDRAAETPDGQPDVHAGAVDRRTDDHRRRRVRADPARQQQRLLPGQRDLLVRLVPARRVVGSPRADEETAGSAAGTPDVCGSGTTSPASPSSRAAARTCPGSRRTAAR